MEQLDLIEYLWVVGFGFPFISIVNTISFFILSKRMFEQDELRTIVTSPFGNGLGVFMFYMALIVVPGAIIFFGLKKIYSNYFMMTRQTTIYLMLLSALVAPWIFLLF